MRKKMVRLAAGCPYADEPPQELDAEEIYRFEWRSSFHGDARVCLTRKDRRLRSHGEYCLPFAKGAHGGRDLQPDDWRRLQAAIIATGFWQAQSFAGIGGLDGAFWTFAARRGQLLHSVTLWSPDGAWAALGQLFVDLADITSVELY